jgi:hypothetical protein
MNENEMGYRGSKSVFNTKPIQNKKLNTVKEQRVDGSWFLKKLGFRSLRCTLMGFERNYQIKILSKQLNTTSFYTISSHNTKLNPFAEGYFCTTIYKAWMKSNILF